MSIRLKPTNDKWPPNHYPPTITGLPTTLYVGELENIAGQERFLYTYTISDQDKDAFTCVNTITANSITLDALATTKTTLLKTLTASSQGGNLVNYTLVSNPSFSPEFFKIDSSTGQITANRDLKYLDSSTPTVYLTVKAHDTVDLIDVYKTQIVNLNMNLDPTVSDAQLESLAVGTVLFTLTIEDPDTTNTHSYRVSCTPPDGDNSFTIDANGNVILSQALDYESITFYTCDFYVDDSISEGGPFTYELTAGSVSFDPGFSCTDQDAGDSATLTYGFHPANNSQRFAINSAGVMTFKEDYDVDNSNMPSPVILTVYCIDDGGTTGVMKTGYVTRAVDKGNPAKTGTTTVDIIYQDDTTTTTTTAATTTAYNFFDHGENIAIYPPRQVTPDS
ncbi:hypothetical protein MAR_032218 [Mya arenaria]|uniref:Cadherin domain-containing protein n=1 Tax=Mya arenaria TaxID=6604 RepID=A0ABY7F8C8_MYAAR|nr:hypothetical protein MAR_032218 [Mya arenaria]